MARPGVRMSKPAVVCHICGKREEGVSIDVTVSALGNVQLTGWAVLTLCPMCVDLNDIKIGKATDDSSTKD